MTGVSQINWKRRGRLAGLAMLLAAALAANSGLARTGAPLPAQPNHATELTAPQIAARVHLDRFFEAVLDENGVAQRDAAVRIVLRGENGRPAFVWLTPFAQDGGQFYGALTEAVAGSQAAAKGLISFDRSQVVDWSFYGDDGRLYGNFTARILLATLQPAQAAEISAQLSKTPAPQGW